VNHLAAGLAALAGALVLRWGSPWVGWPLLVAAAVAAWRLGPREAATTTGTMSFAQELGVLGAITAVGAMLRFLSLDVMPPGLWFDEAENGLETLRLMAGHVFVFTPNNNGRGALQFFWTAPFFAAFGATPWALRAAIAAAGTLTIPVAWLLFRRLAGGGWALFAAGLLAVSSWHLHVSRIAFDVAFTPLMDLLAIHAAMLAVGGSTGWLLATGALAGIANYGYQASRVTPLIAGAFLRGSRRGRVAIAAAAFAACLLPLLVYAVRHPGQFVQRGRQVTIARDMVEQRSLAPLARSVGGTVRMFHQQGDENPRHNDPGRPMLDPVTGALFVLGLVWGHRLAPRGVFAPAMAWLLLPLVFGGVLTVKAPHANRTVAAIPAVCLFATWGARGLLGAIRWRVAVAVVLIVLAGTFGVGAYFVAYASYPGLEEAFSANATDVGEFMRTLPPGTAVTTVGELNPSVVAFVAGRPMASFRSLGREAIASALDEPGVVIVRDGTPLPPGAVAVESRTGRFGTRFHVITVAP